MDTLFGKCRILISPLINIGLKTLVTFINNQTFKYTMATRGALRGAHRGVRSLSTGHPCKTPKRDHSHVSPVSPQMSFADVKRALLEELTPIYEDFKELS